MSNIVPSVDEQPLVAIAPLPNPDVAAKPLLEQPTAAVVKAPAKPNLTKQGKRKYYQTRVEDFSARVEKQLEEFEQRVLKKLEEYSVAMQPVPEVNTPAHERSFVEKVDASGGPILPKTELAMSDSESFRAISTPYRAVIENEGVPMTPISAGLPGTGLSILSQPGIMRGKKNIMKKR